MTAATARSAAVVVLLAVVAGVLPGAGAIRSSAATWSDAALDRAVVRVASDSCTATGVYTGQGSSALLAGSVLGTAVGAPALLTPVATGERTDASSTSRSVVTPAAAADAAAAGIALTPASSWSQTGTTTGTGTSTATAGGPAALGAVDVSGLLTRPPDRTSSLPGLSGVGVDVGAVSSSSSLNGCAAAWGDPATLSRTSSVASLGLRFSDSAVTAALAAMRTRGTAAAANLTAAAAAPSTTAALTQAVSSGLLAAVSQSVTGDLFGPPSATVSLSTGTAPITATAAGSQVSGRATLDVASGSVVVNLPVPAGPNGDALSSAQTASAAAATGTALRQRATALTDAETAARDGAVLTVHGAVDVLTLANLRIATVAVDFSAPVSAWRSGVGLNLGATVQLAGAAPLGVDAAVIGAKLPTTLLPGVQTALADSFVTPVTASIAADVTAVGGLTDSATTALGTDLAALPSVLTVTTDQRATTAADSWTGGVPAGSGGVTAVRVRVKDLAGTRADLFIGSTAVGPNRGAFR